MKKTKGITLIALVITVIVLLILAGVAINTVIGNDSIIKNAENAVGKYNNGIKEEQKAIDNIINYMEQSTGGGSSTPSAPVTPPKDDPPTTPTVDSNGLATKNTTIIPDKTNNPNLQIVIPTGFAPAILQTGTTQSLPGQDGSVKNKMPASEWNNIKAEDINKGIVVVDGDGNEFVWIPITDSSEFARKAWSKYTLVEEESTSMGYWEDKTTSEYTQMVKSVTTNKGFYIARYEASQNNDSTKVQSKRNATVWTSISQTDAITKSANYNAIMYPHLIYGIEWDSILNWLNGNATISSSTNEQTKTMELSDIQANSSSWGNYANSTGDASTNSGGDKPQTSGKSEYWKANNIYDLAGNVREWTQEKYTTTLRAARGGTYAYDGDFNPAAHRYCNEESYTSDVIGFRVSFYL